MTDNANDFDPLKDDELLGEVQDAEANLDRLKYSTIVIQGKSRTLDTFKASTKLNDILEKYDDEDTSYLDEIVEWINAEWELTELSATWAEAHVFVSQLSAVSQELKKNIDSCVILRSTTTLTRGHLSRGNVESSTTESEGLTQDGD